MQRVKLGAGGALFGLLFALTGVPAKAADQPEVAYTLTADKGGSIHSAQFSPDSKRVFTLGSKPLIGVWDGATGKAIETLGLPGVRSVVGLSADGSRAVTQGEGDTVLVWDVEAGKRLVELKGRAGETLVILQLSPDGERVATVSGGKTAKVWAVKTGNLIGSFTGHKGPIASGAFNADGTRLATGSYFGEVKVWDPESGKELLDLQGMSTSNNPTMFSADGTLIVSPRHETPAVWSAKDGKLVQEFKGHKGWCRTARFDPAGGRIVTVGQDETTRVWDVKTGKAVYTLKHVGDFGYASFSPDGTSVLTVSGGNVRVWRLPAQK